MKITENVVKGSNGKNDECYTHRYAVEPILKFIKPNSTIWCPFDKDDSEFVKVFKEKGFNVINTHIDYGQDFYQTEIKECDYIISNPPFTNKKEIFKRLISFNKPFAMIMSILWLNDNTPFYLFKNINFQLLMFNDRMTFKNQRQDNQISFKSAYFCRDFLPEKIMWEHFNDYGQTKLF